MIHHYDNTNMRT